MSTENEAAVLNALAEWEKKEGALPTALSLQKKLLLVQVEIEARAKAPVAPAEAVARERAQNGRPLLEFNELDIDPALLREALERTIAVFCQEFSFEIPESVSNLISHPDFLAGAARAAFQGVTLPFPPGLSETNTGILVAGLRAALKPFLTVYREALSGLVNQEQWKRRYCPVCGGAPDFAFLDKERGARWLLCSRCDMRWLFQRLECPACGNQDQNTLSYFTDEQGLYRLYVCEKCRCYFKAIDLRQAKADVLLPLERLLTLDLDAQAQAGGYVSCVAAAGQVG